MFTAVWGFCGVGKEHFLELAMNPENVPLAPLTRDLSRGHNKGTRLRAKFTVTVIASAILDNTRPFQMFFV